MDNAISIKEPVPVGKVPVGQAVQALQALQHMSRANFPARTAYRIGRVIARLQLHPDIIAADQARRAAVIKFGELQPDGSSTVPPARLQEFVEEYDPVSITPIELDIHRLPMSILDEAPEMTPGEMIALESFLEGE